MVRTIPEFFLHNNFRNLCFARTLKVHFRCFLQSKSSNFQVVCLAVHLYFLVTIFARQYIIAEKEEINEIDAYFPFMTVIQFAFYMGWMKVGINRLKQSIKAFQVIEALLNPFGEDDDDFETNALIDRNITVGIVFASGGLHIRGSGNGNNTRLM